MESDGNEQKVARFEMTHYGAISLEEGQPLRKGFRDEEGGSSLYAGYVNLVNSVVGSGILGLPVAFASTGWVLGYILIGLAAAASSFSLHLLTCCGKKVSHPASFDSITEAAYPGYGYVVDLVVSCLCFGNATSYLVVLSKLMPEVMNFFNATPFWQNRQVWVTVGLAIVGPLSFKKSMDALEFTNSMGLVSVLFITAVIVAFSMNLPGLDPCADNVELCEEAITQSYSLTGSTVSHLGVFVFSYTCQMNLFPLVNEMASPTVERCNKVIGSALFTAMILYGMVASAGYLTYGNMVESNILVNYPFTPLTSLARVAVSLLVACSYPLQCVPSRNCALSLWKTCAGDQRVSEEREHVRYLIITACFVFLSYGIALIVDDLGIVIALLGATGSTVINYILPGAVYWQLFEKEGATWKRQGAGALLLLGCIIMPVCVTFIFWPPK